MFDSQTDTPEGPPEAGAELLEGAAHYDRLAELDTRIGELFGNIAAAEAQLCEALAEFDARGGWHSQGARSIEQWMSWRGGTASKIARDYAAVARRLPELPAVKGSFSAGEISLSKARAICSIATPATEAMLVDWARSCTAADMDRIARTWNRIKADEDLAEAERRRADRTCDWHVDEHGMMRLKARLGAEDGALLAKAIEQALQAQHDEDKDNPAAEERTFPQRRADALVAVAERSLASDGAELKDRYLANIHVDLDVLTQEGTDGRCEIFPGASLSPKTVERILCDCPAVSIVFKDGGVLNMGRRTRAISARQKRALQARDVTCRFPGCTSQVHLDGHHVRHWTPDLGPTDLDNLCLLCRYHHRLMHEGGFSMAKKGDEFVFYDPFGTAIPNAPPQQRSADLEAHNRARGLTVDDRTIVPPHYHGDKMDIHSVMYVFDQEMREPFQEAE